jgi:ABC-type sugar transport system ATPase subunit
MVKIVLENITKRFGEKVAVDDLSLEIKDRELFCLTGPPKAGKTTTLRIVAGLEKPDEGEVYFNGRPVTHLPPSDRKVGFFFEILALFPFKNGFENIAFPLRVRNLPESEVRKRVLEVARLLRIEHLLDREPRTFSGGEMQRVALARAIVWPREVLILDEPLSNIDALLRVSMRVELKRLKEEFKQTTLYATHDPIEAMAIADRIGVMNLGRLQQFATPEEIYNQPANRFVAGFIGSPPMNFIDCTFIEEGGKAYLDAGPFRLDVTKLAGAIKANASSSELILGIRPEHIKVNDEGREGSIKATIQVTEPLGSKIIITLTPSKGMNLRAIGEPGLAYKTGEDKWISILLDRIHIFDKRTEKVII